MNGCQSGDNPAQAESYTTTLCQNDFPRNTRTVGSSLEFTIRTNSIFTSSSLQQRLVFLSSAVSLASERKQKKARGKVRAGAYRAR